MNKRQLFANERVHNQLLIDSIARRTGLPKSHIKTFLNAFTDELLERLSAQQIINIARLGQLRIRRRASRHVRPPNAKESIYVPSRRYVKFTAFKSLRNRVED